MPVSAVLVDTLCTQTFEQFVNASAHRFLGNHKGCTLQVLPISLAIATQVCSKKVRNLIFCKIYYETKLHYQIFDMVHPFPIKPPENKFLKSSVAHNIKISSNGDICKKYCKHFQDTDVLDRMVELVRWCPYFKSATLKFLQKEL